ncbi:CDP-diacylglycerol--glycerol-3-phosphate 3-phosphatidyltransferase [Planctomycetes bacterium MalM25]|nr:CDP-diacylglycerol--glycerol-3-phosphate 3-phosphatidyltransferase [Planctomycetes bacterium MalM25]
MARFARITRNEDSLTTEPTNDVPLGSLSDVPNQITVTRLVATVACFVCLSLGWYPAGLVLFLLAAATDWADGYWARRWGPITKLGRILDPLADKLLICGVFVYLTTIPDSDVAPWMAVVVLARELLVTTLRAVVEGSGGDFSAVWIGKWKMVAQCIAAAMSLLQVSGLVGMQWPGVWRDWEPGAWTVVDLAVWLAVALTILSGVTYTRSALRVLADAERESNA